MPPSEDIREVLVWVAEDRTASGSGCTDFVEEPPGFAEFLRVDGVTEQGVNFIHGHERMERDGVHVHPPVGGSGPVGCGASSGASAEVVFPGSIEALKGVGGLRDATVVV